MIRSPKLVVAHETEDLVRELEAGISGEVRFDASPAQARPG
jgi:hypothetical protein